MNNDFISPLNIKKDDDIKVVTNSNVDLKFDAKLNIVLTSPRGFCAGVRRAVEIVERAIAKYGVPLYVKHEIVHNKFVVEYFKNKGVIFIDDEKKVPDGQLIIYSAHGVSEEVELNSKKKHLKTIDATCPLVKKVHREVILYDDQDIEIILIGHKNHPEMLGTSGRVRSGNFTIIETIDDAKLFTPKNQDKIAIATQTTLSITQTQGIVNYLTEKFPSIKQHERLKNDICYATENRQEAIKNVLKNHPADLLVVIGAYNSSNSNRLADIGSEFGVKSFLTEKFNEDIVEFIRIKILSQKDKQSVNTVITAGASAPEILVNDFISNISSYFQDCTITIKNFISEDTYFILPKDVR